MAGRLVSCPKCASRLQVPSAQVELDLESEAFDEQPSDLSASHASSGRSLRLWIVALIVGLASIAVITVVIVAVIRSRDSNTVDKLATGKKQVEKHAPSKVEEIFKDAGEGAKAGFALGFVLLTLALIVVYAFFVYWMMSWVARDSYNRGHEGALWAVIYIIPHLWFSVPYTAFVFFPALTFVSPIGFVFWITGLIVILPLSWSGFAVYLASRRKGILVSCEHCHNKRLEYVRQCSHCGHQVSED
jgi:hypothetical protein